MCIHKPAKEAIAIMARPTRSVAVAMVVAKGFVSVTKTMKMPRRMRTTAEREIAFLVSRLILFSNGTLWRGIAQPGKVGPPGAAPNLDPRSDLNVMREPGAAPPRTRAPACGADLRWPFHDDKARPLQMLDHALRHDLGHDLVSVLDPLAALVLERIGERRGKVGWPQLVGLFWHWTRIGEAGGNFPCGDVVNNAATARIRASLEFGSNLVGVPLCRPALRSDIIPVGRRIIIGLARHDRHGLAIAKLITVRPDKASWRSRIDLAYGRTVCGRAGPVRFPWWSCAWLALAFGSLPLAAATPGTRQARAQIDAAERKAVNACFMS